MGFSENKTLFTSSNIFQRVWMSFGCRKHSHVIGYRSLLSARSCTEAKGLRDASRRVKKICPSCATATESLHALSPFLTHTSLSYFGTTVGRTRGSENTRFQKFKQPSGSIARPSPCIHSMDTTPRNKEYWIQRGHPRSKSQPVWCEDEFKSEKAHRRKYSFLWQNIYSTAFNEVLLP